MVVSQSEAQAKPGVCIFLLQLGGPKDMDTIVPFLTELFADVLPLPRLLAKPLGKLIATRRLPEVGPLYKEIGGGSPLLRHTQSQADALQQALAARGVVAHMLICMRYAPPRMEEALSAARALGPDVPWVAVPLYPQYSFATTRSSLREMHKLMTKPERKALRSIESYQTEPGYLQAMADTIVETLPDSSPEALNQTILVFSAHGLPLKLVREGDPYPKHIEQTLHGTLALLRERLKPMPQHVLCFQSRVGPIKWLEPSTQDTLIRLGKEGWRKVLVIPIAFVSEHIETLHELDIELREVAKEVGITEYHRAPTVMVRAPFIDGLAEQVAASLKVAPQHKNK